MNISEVNRGELKRYRPAHPVIGMDIGSRAAKGVLLTPDSIYTEQVITGLSMQQTADELLDQTLEGCCFEPIRDCLHRRHWIWAYLYQVRRYTLSSGHRDHLPRTRCTTR